MLGVPEKDLYHSDGNKSCADVLASVGGLRDKTVITKPNRHAKNKSGTYRREPGWNK